MGRVCFSDDAPRRADDTHRKSTIFVWQQHTEPPYIIHDVIKAMYLQIISLSATFKLSFRTIYCRTTRTVSCLHLRWLTCGVESVICLLIVCRYLRIKVKSAFQRDSMWIQIRISNTSPVTKQSGLLFCSLAVFDPIMWALVTPWTYFGYFLQLSVLCHSDGLFHWESCPRIDVVHQGRAWSSSPACTCQHFGAEANVASRT